MEGLQDKQKQAGGLKWLSCHLKYPRDEVQNYSKTPDHKLTNNVVFRMNFSPELCILSETIQHSTLLSPTWWDGKNISDTHSDHLHV